MYSSPGKQPFKHQAEAQPEELSLQPAACSSAEGWTGERPPGLVKRGPSSLLALETAASATPSLSVWFQRRERTGTEGPWEDG
ncbi:Zinc finger protein 500 [Manis javanica]|nr:Zinc finger protein 500 [Manis javanica]